MEEWYVKSADGSVYGPTDRVSLVQWAREGRIDPSGYVSRDRLSWLPAPQMPELEMTWVVETETGKFYGPFNRAVVVRLAGAGSIPAGANIYRRHGLPPDQDPAPERIEVPVEKIVEKEVRVEVPVEKIVERVIEVAPPPQEVVREAEVAEAEGVRMPRPQFGGIFKGADRARMAALEAAARRELSAAKRGGFGGMNGFFARRKP